MPDTVVLSIFNLLNLHKVPTGVSPIFIPIVQMKKIRLTEVKSQWQLGEEQYCLSREPKLNLALGVPRASCIRNQANNKKNSNNNATSVTLGVHSTDLLMRY